MATVNISLPARLREFVEQRVESAGYSTVSEYFRELIRSDQERQAEAKLETLLLEGLRSGKSKPYAKRDVDEILKRVRTTAKAKR